MAETQDGLEHSVIDVLDHPFEIFRLEVGDANMAHHALSLELGEGRECECVSNAEDADIDDLPF